MRSLELKIPPPVVALAVALVMWAVTLLVPPMAVPSGVRLTVSVILAGLGIAISAAGMASFRKAQTTTNPMKPDTASALVSSGIYRKTRNPMYLGILFVLIGWGVFLANAVSVLCSFLFVLYMNRFQIAPEERSLSAKFGVEFMAYKASVRRWI